MKTRKILPVLCLSLLLCALLSVSAFAADPVFLPASGQNLSIDGVLREYAQPVANYAGYTMLPLRSLAPDLGVPNDDEHILYKAATKEVTLISADGNLKVGLQQGSATAWVEKLGEKKEVMLDCPVQNHAGLLYIPVSFVAKNLDMLVTYDAPTRTVLIRSPESLAEVDAVRGMMPDEKPTKLAIDLAVAMTMEADGETAKIDMSGNLNMDITDLEKLLLSAVLSMDSAGEKMDIGIYSDGENLYVAQDGTTSKLPLAAAMGAMNPESLTKILGDANFLAIVGEMEDGMRARMFTKPGEEKNQIVIYGDLTSVFSPDSAFSGMINSMLGGLAGQMQITKYTIEIVMDTVTKLPVAMTADMSVIMKAAELELNVGANMTLTFDFSDTITVTIPEDVVKNAVPAQ